jgi:DNA repair exonuclease SbcCD ATPase subunit
MTAAVEPLPPALSTPTKKIANEIHTQSCPTCGTAIDMPEVEEARRRIAELESQMELLKEKATAAGTRQPPSSHTSHTNIHTVDKCADYEDQLRSLQRAPPLPRTQTSQSDTFAPQPRTSTDEPARPTTSSSTKASRFSFLMNRFPSPANTGSMPPPPPPPKDASQSKPPIDYGLLNELERERALRFKAEARVQTVDSEIEELSVQLFSQANEMVAEERRARAKLEERVEMLERRDREKMGRLDRLEKAVCRVERVKALLGEKEEKGKVAGGVGLLSPPARR